MSDFNFGWIEEGFRRGDERERRAQEELSRLRAEPCMDEAEIGDGVLVSAGLIGHGHFHEIRELEVIEKSSVAYKVRLQREYSKTPWEDWIQRTLILDVIPKKGPGDEW